MRRSRFVMIVALLTALIFCVETSAVSAASLSEVRKNIQSKQQEIKDSKEKEQDLSDKIAAMEKQISSKEADISKLEKAIGEAETQLGTLQKQLKEAEAKVDQQDEDLGSRLRNMYKNGSIGFIDVLLDSDNISEFLTNLDMVQKVYSQDQDTLETLKEASAEIDKKKKEIESLQSELTASKELVQEEKQSLQADKTEVEKQKATVTADIAESEDELDQMQDEEAAIEEAIRAEEKRKAEEAAKAAAAAEAAKKNNSSSSSSSSSSSKPSSSKPSSSSSSKPSTRGKLTTYKGLTMQFPAPSMTRKSSNFGYRIHPIKHTKRLHAGVDLAAPGGSPIVAAMSGRVILARAGSGYGNYIIVDHGNGYATLYAHCSKLLVKKGQSVSRGQQIAKVGSTGASTGNHLHFEVRVKGTPVNPASYIGL